MKFFCDGNLLVKCSLFAGERFICFRFLAKNNLHDKIAQREKVNAFYFSLGFIKKSHGYLACQRMYFSFLRYISKSR